MAPSPWSGEMEAQWGHHSCVGADASKLSFIRCPDKSTRNGQAETNCRKIFVGCLFSLSLALSSIEGSTRGLGHKATCFPGPRGSEQGHHDHKLRELRPTNVSAATRASLACLVGQNSPNTASPQSTVDGFFPSLNQIHYQRSGGKPTSWRRGLHRRIAGGCTDIFRRLQARWDCWQDTWNLKLSILIWRLVILWKPSGFFP